ncbi:MAG TPA: carbohydrate ABC transporter permease [Firmicutes bacterium]|jgi:ABC-type glycerol-3-phosphate transport system permease component|nr:carbohydrate ABC transporter permease [Bacillota bacterium]
MKILRPSNLSRSVGGDLLNLFFLVLCGFLMALPLLYTIFQALKPLDEIFIFPPRFYVRNPTLDNFVQLLVMMGESWVPFSRYFFNTIFVTVAGTFGHVIIASMAAFVLSKHKFPGRNLFFSVVILALMFSYHVTQIPNYLIMARINWVDTYLALIVPYFSYPLGLFLMKQFMEQIPDSLLESARIDGAGEFRIFWQIVMPSVKPAWLTLIIFIFQQLWTMQGGVYIYSEQLKTLSYAFSQILIGGAITIARAGVSGAVGLLMMIPPIVLFIITQSNIMETMATSGIKE